MQTPEWLKPGLYGAACGAVALAVIGFSWGGWVTGGTARTMAADQSKAEVVTALSLICVDQSKRDPQLVERVALHESGLVLGTGRSRDEEWLGDHARNDRRQSPCRNRMR